MKSLITGAGGFAGSYLAEYLLQQNQEVIALVNPQNNLLTLHHILSQIRVERMDIRDSDRLEQILVDVQPQRVYHLAAVSSPTESLADPKVTYDVNVLGTFNLLNACRRLVLDCRVLYVSSAEVYGGGEKDSMPLREDSPFRPANPYAASKAAGEMVAYQFYRSYGLPVVRARPFNHTGPRQSDAYLCSSLARQVANIEAGAQPPQVTAGNLKLRRDFSDVRDVVRGYHLLLEKGTEGDVYHLCSGKPVLLESILEILGSFSCKPFTVTVDESRRRSGELPEIWGDYSKATADTGWAPQYELRTTLLDLKRYWEEINSTKTPEAS
ncbi:MAG TPA: GDP-mannose 4,6-dehydratase [Terriglobia bacterium]|nr:GDP-mannose 4,6-dehydratase [Terriglobia bacterium]